MMKKILCQDLSHPHGTYEIKNYKSHCESKAEGLTHMHTDIYICRLCNAFNSRTIYH
jgi:hypothetical protein